jgi:nitrate reductase beta subunit
MGMVLYDADKILETVESPNELLVEKQKAMILDPNDPEVIEGALRNGIHQSVVEYSQRSPVWKFLKEWNLALPLHAEHRTLPMLFYVPPLLPIMASVNDGNYDTSSPELFGKLENARLPMKYLASLFGAGNEGPVRYALKKQMAVRLYNRQKNVGDLDPKVVEKMLAEADTTPEQCEAIYQLTSLPLFDQRFVIPPSHREEAIAALDDPQEYKGATGFGPRVKPERGM